MQQLHPRQLPGFQAAFLPVAQVLHQDGQAAKGHRPAHKRKHIFRPQPDQPLHAAGHLHHALQPRCQAFPKPRKGTLHHSGPHAPQHQ